MMSRYHLHIFMSLLLIALCSCVDYQPDEVRTIADIDETCCDLLHDTSYVSLETKGGIDLQSYWIDAELSTVADTFATLPVNTSLEITYSTRADTSYDTSYAFLDNRDGIPEVVFVMNDYWDIAFIEKDGAVIEFSSDLIAIEAVAFCTGLEEVEENKWAAVPSIRTRYVFELEEVPYLVRFAKTEATLGTPPWRVKEKTSFRAAIVEGS
jgi:hypothetical protein